MQQPHPDIEALKENYRNGTLQRREFLSKAFMLGVPAPLAYLLIGEITEAEVQAQAIDANEAADQFARLGKFAVHPSVVQAIREIQNAAPKKRQELAEAFVKKMQTPEYRKQLGMEDSQFRISTRVFENPRDRTLAYAKAPSIAPITPSGGTICASAGVVVCVSYGIEK